MKLNLVNPALPALDPTESADRRRSLFRRKLDGFFSRYFMAFHWRTWSIALSFAASILAVPSSSEGMHGRTSTSIFLQYFIRFLVLSAASWLFVFVLLTIGTGIYGRFSTANIMDDAIHYEEGELTRFESARLRCLRLFCLMDSHGIKDVNRCWSRFKMIVCTLSVVIATAHFIGYAILGDGAMWFAGLSRSSCGLL